MKFNVFLIIKILLLKLEIIKFFVLGKFENITVDGYNGFIICTFFIEFVLEAFIVIILLIE